MTQPLPLRYLSGADVVAIMPPVAERLALAEATLRGLAADADLPSKIGVHPRTEQSFGHAMPAYLPGAAADHTADHLGMKWVLGFPPNAAAGLPVISATLLDAFLTPLLFLKFGERPLERLQTGTGGLEPAQAY